MPALRVSDEKGNGKRMQKSKDREGTKTFYGKRLAGQHMPVYLRRCMKDAGLQCCANCSNTPSARSFNLSACRLLYDVEVVVLGLCLIFFLECLSSHHSVHITLANELIVLLVLLSISNDVGLP